MNYLLNVSDTRTVKKLIFETSKRVVHFLNAECKHEWMRRALYCPPMGDVEVEGNQFRVSTTGGPLVSFLSILLLPIVIQCEFMDFSMLTYNNKRYGANVDIDLNKVSADDAGDYYNKMKNLTFYTPVWLIPRFLSTVKDILEPQCTKCQFGKCIVLICTDNRHCFHI